MLCGKLLTAAEAIANKLVGYNQLRIEYKNGTVVYANANAKENYTFKYNGKNITLPPYGYYAINPGKVETASILRNGKRVDYEIQL